LNFQWIDSDAALIEAVARCREFDWVAIDTEFMRTDTYYPKVGLLQLGVPGHNYLIDPLSLEDPSPIRELLLSPSVLKVLHSGSEDMEVFQRWLEIAPSPLFDTQMAAAALGLGFGLSYQRLIEAMVGEVIPKGETRSDWLQRPLTQSQCAYAAQDVHFLVAAYPMIRDQLNEAGRLDWVLEDAKRLTQTLPTMVPVEDAYRRQKGLHHLGPRALLLAQELFRWREQEARRRDRPRNRVLHDEQVMGLLRLPENAWTDLKQAGFHNGTIQRVGDAILAMVDKVLAVAPNALPEPLQADRTPVDKKRYKKLQDALADLAKGLGVPTEYIATRRDLEHVIKSDFHGEASLPASFEGWRRECAGDVLLKALV